MHRLSGLSLLTTFSSNLIIFNATVELGQRQRADHNCLQKLRIHRQVPQVKNRHCSRHVVFWPHTAVDYRIDTGLEGL